MSDEVTVDRDQAWREGKSALADSLEQTGPGVLSTLSLPDLGAIHWNLTILQGLLEAELAYRDGTTDMAGQR